MIEKKSIMNKLKNKSLKFIVKRALRKIYEAIYYRFREIIIKNMNSKLEDKYFVNVETEMINFFNYEESDYYVQKLYDLNVVEQIICDAEKIMAHKFNFLGMKEIYLGKEIQWNKDYRSGFVWENKYYKKIKKVNLHNKADIKYPWELSRFQHFFTLGKAFWITGEEKYAMEFQSQILHWIKENPVEMSVNWTCTMDVAIRAVNWITAACFFKSSSKLEKSFWVEFNRALYSHGRFIYNNLENRGSHTNNHYTSNLCGLIWIGLYFKGIHKIVKHHIINNPKEWLKFGVSNLEKEITIQVNEDGTSYEGSTSYHRLLTELFLDAALICRKNKIYMSQDYQSKVKKMCNFILQLTKANFLSPLIGDADDGRFLIFSNYYTWKRNDFTHVLAMASYFFKDNKFNNFNEIYLEDLLWVGGNCKAVKGASRIKRSCSFMNGGFYILRDENIYCIIRCGELSYKGQGGHSHNDQLSVEINVKGVDFIIDPGSYVYTSDYKSRNFFRSTNSHNTISIGGFEQNTMVEKDIFTLNEETFSKCTAFSEDSFEGYHNGFSNKCGIIHKREVIKAKYKLTIKDVLQGDISDKDIFLNFVLHEKVTANINKNEVTLINGKVKLVIIFETKDIEICDWKISYNYGEIINTKKIRAKITSNINYTTIKFNDIAASQMMI